MPTEHIKIRQKIKEIANIFDFNELLDKTTLTDEDKLMIRMHYIEGKNFNYIADILGYAESTIKYRHHLALVKIGKIL